MATDAKCVENLAGLSAVRGLMPSSRDSGRGQRESTGMASYLGQDMQTPSMLSTLRLRRFAWYLEGEADASPFFAYLDEPTFLHF